MELIIQKKSLRSIVKQSKKNLSDANREKSSFEVFSKVEKLPQFLDSNVVLAYWSLPDEICTHSFIEKWYKKKTILLPVVQGDDLVLKQFSGIDRMVVGSSYGILEPQTEIVADKENIDFAIVPGIAFDYLGNRLGRGRGYYDRLLVGTKIFKVGVGYSFQLFSSVPVEEYDIPMDYVICC